MVHYYKEAKTLEEKFEILKERYLNFLIDEFNINFEFKNLDWLYENIKNFLPIEFYNFDLSPTFEWLSDKNITKSYFYWEGKKLNLTWKNKYYSILINIDLHSKEGFYSEMDYSNFECFEVSNLNMSIEEGWIKLVDLLKKFDLD